MNVMVSILGASALSVIGYKVFDRFHIPASKIIGPIFIVALVQLTGITFILPSMLQVVFSILFGVYLGLRFDKDALRQLRRLIVPSIAISVVYLILTMGYGFLLTKISGMDRYTSFLAVIPGGIAETGVLAVSFGANLAQVTAFQLLRFLSIIMIVPLLTKHVIVRLLKLEPTEKEKVPVFVPASENTMPMHTYLWLFVVGLVGALLFKWLRLPAALLLGATFSVSATQLIIKTPFKTPPKRIYDMAQIGMGAVIGTSFTLESMKVVATLWMPLMMMTGLIISSSLLIAYMFGKLFKLDFLTSLMSVLPGGLSTMIVLAEDFESDIVTISTLQLARLLTAVMVIPILYSILL